MLITNLKENGEYVGSLADGEIEFHSDGIYIEEPLAATMLFCISPTSRGGETAFANMYRAYETLPDDIRSRIDGRKALHAFTYDSARTDQNAARKTNRDDVAHFVHPVVRTHPVTGRKALYVNRLIARRSSAWRPTRAAISLISCTATWSGPSSSTNTRGARGTLCYGTTAVSPMRGGTFRRASFGS